MAVWGPALRVLLCSIYLSVPIGPGGHGELLHDPLLPVQHFRVLPFLVGLAAAYVTIPLGDGRRGLQSLLSGLIRGAYLGR